ncbi:phospholipid hydroperoxide glutathione peroxidase, mitochondrial-like [Copidosoma floridanum]|uniref:phospholipid hydroperoxide glutathione peroxidase, mitochondrial-like n=1 Tax=Copidosoma floridanum TaxID=29053 RepID=UPI0006C98122|nr:phospholipid hydroperoxide glutathione peroxidase, mitochondrial-like [Copidosoma floridanum]
MRPIVCVVLLLGTLLHLSHATLAFDQEIDWPSAKSLHDFQARDLSGNLINLEKYRGHVLVLLNGATRSCPVSAKGFKLLQQLKERHGSKGLEVASFVVDGLVKPSGTAEDIKEYVQSTGLTYDVYDKIATDGDAAHPLYKWIKMCLEDKVQAGSKVLFDKNGKIVAKFGPTGSPAGLEEAIEQLL